MSEDISLIPYDRITNLPSDLNLMKSQITNLQTDLSATTNTLQSSIDALLLSINSLQTSINQIDTTINGISDYIIDYNESSNKTQWYRLWKSGWIEQGGKYAHTTSGGSEINTDITLPYSFSSTSYQVILNTYRNDMTPYNPSYYQACYQVLSLNKIKVRCQGANNAQYIDGLVYYACGY